MEIILLSNGQGINRFESINIQSGRIPIKFVGAPPNSVLMVVSERITLRHIMSEDMTYELDVNRLVGDVKFTISHDCDIWTCDGIRVEKSKDGSITIMSLSKYYDHIKKCMSEIASLRNYTSKLNGEITELRNELRKHKEYYQVI